MGGGVGWSGKRRVEYSRLKWVGVEWCAKCGSSEYNGVKWSEME